MPGVKIGWKMKKKKIFSAREQDLPISYLYRYTAHDEKHKFQKFWTWDFENGAPKWPQLPA